MIQQKNIYPPWLNPLVDFFFPPLCPGCGEVVEAYPSFCPPCDKRIDRLQDSICLHCFGFYHNESETKRCCESPLPIFVFATYNQPFDEIIKQFKFHGITFPAAHAADALTEQWRSMILALQPEAITPIPLHIRREKWRGFNQAAVFAKELSNRLHIPVASDLLERTHARKPQSKLSLEHRSGNISGVFHSERYDGMPKRVILVDDVITTGTTMKEAAKACQDVGVEVVGCIGMAISSYAISV